MRLGVTRETRNPYLAVRLLTQIIRIVAISVDPSNMAMSFAKANASPLYVPGKPHSQHPIQVDRFLVPFSHNIFKVAVENFCENIVTLSDLSFDLKIN